jgi:RNA polymerase sigma factor (sigma-70 family)
MTGPRPADLLRHLEVPDRELLARFVASRDQGAFAQLVRRHGPVVLGVCRKITGHPQDAEDAFQAAFLVLARKAASVANPDLLGNYLYGVAVRVAQRARRSASRRRAHEVQVATMPDPAVSEPSPHPDVGPVLHGELSKLPACYRDAIVLCDLRGVSRSDAAAALGVPEGTLSSRLANGRKKLADRLARRGVSLSVAAVPAALGEGRAAVPELLIGKTCGLVADWGAGAVVPAPVSRLAAGGFDVKKAFVMGVGVVALAAAGVVFAGRPAQEPPKPPEPPKKVVVAEKPDNDPKAATFTADPRLTHRISVSVDPRSYLHWNSQGTRIALFGSAEDVRAADPKKFTPGVVVITPERGAATSTWYQPHELVGFTPDGRSVVVEHREYNLLSGYHRLFVHDVEAEPRKTQTIDIPADRSSGYAFARDGKTFRTVASLSEEDSGAPVLEVRDVDITSGRVVKKVLRVPGVTFGLSPDGKRLAVLESGNGTVVVHDADTESKRVAELPAQVDKDLPPASPSNYRLIFSADGRRLVVSWGPNSTFVINADTGKLEPRLERLAFAETSPQPHAFTADGRLLALRGRRYSLRKKAGDRGQAVIQWTGSFVCVWDTQTGKALKIWEQQGVTDRVAAIGFSPAGPILATVEKAGEFTSRLGLWDFAAEVPGKK